MPAAKKSETLEVRLPYAAKQAFMAHCRARGATASEAVRAFIEADIGAPAKPPSRRLHWIAAAAVVLGFGAMAAPSLARPSLPVQFARLDSDHDGGLSRAEFARAADLQMTVTVGPARLIPVSRGPDALPALRDGLIGAEFERIDADRDGRISLAEFRRAYAR